MKTRITKKDIVKAIKLKLAYLQIRMQFDYDDVLSGFMELSQFHKTTKENIKELSNLLDLL